MKEITLKGQLSLNQLNIQFDLAFFLKGIVVLNGKSGIGKTTLLKVIAGVEKDPKLNVSVGEQLFQDSDFFLSPAKRSIGFMFQDYQLFPFLNVFENINYAKKSKKFEKFNVDFDLVIDSLGLSSFLEKPITSLSGGEQQRVALARAILSNPACLILDEPLSSLDSKTKENAISLLKTLWDKYNIPTIFVGHNFEETAILGSSFIELSNAKATYYESFGSFMHEFDKNQLDNYFEGRISKIDTNYTIATIEAFNVKFLVSSVGLNLNTEYRFKIKANTIGVSKEKLESSSYVNQISGTIIRIEKLNEDSSFLEVKLEGNKLVNVVISRFSKDNLKLVENQKIFLSIKLNNITILK